MVDGAFANAANTNARFVIDFDPGTVTKASIGRSGAVGAFQLMATTVVGDRRKRGSATVARATLTDMRNFLVGLFTFAGVMHFIRPEGFDALVPPALPLNQRFYTLASGAAEVGTAALLVHPSTRRVGGWATLALMAGVWPGNIYMAYDWRDHPLWQRAIAYGRIPLQLPLLRAGWNIAHQQD